MLHGSESLCKLLRYLARHVLDHPGTPIKEYQIATEVFGRSADFDPQLDSMVRVQAGRLRVKLSEYYAGDGAEDPIIVELPKGTYVLAFHHRAYDAGESTAAGNGAAAPHAAAGIGAPAELDYRDRFADVFAGGGGSGDFEPGFKSELGSGGEFP